MDARTLTGIAATCLLLLAAPSRGAEGAGEASRRAMVPMNLMGLPLGTGTDNGVRVDVYLLQEAYPERRPPDAPTHLFSMTVSDGATGESLTDASVSLVVLRTGSAEGRRIPANYARPFYRAGARLPELGEYSIVVECSAGGRSAKVAFPYRYEPAPAQHSQGKDPQPVIEGDSPPGPPGSR